MALAAWPLYLGKPVQLIVLPRSFYGGSILVCQLAVSVFRIHFPLTFVLRPVHFNDDPVATPEAIYPVSFIVTAVLPAALAQPVALLVLVDAAIVDARIGISWFEISGRMGRLDLQDLKHFSINFTIRVFLWCEAQTEF